MTRFWRLVAILSALCVASAAMAVGASGATTSGGKGKAKQAPAQIDKRFGVKGVAKIATGGPYAEKRVQMALGPNGRVYALQANLLLAFEADGKPARDFGDNGRLRLESTHGEIQATGLVVDSWGRILISGTITLYPFRRNPSSQPESRSWGYSWLHEAFVSRYLEDGSPDSTFGDGGEADTTFGLPRPTGQPGSGVEFEHPMVEATTLAVDPQDRPVVGGAYVDAVLPCAYDTERHASFTARLTATGAPDASYAGKGYVTGPNGTVHALAATPGGGVATLSSGTAFCAMHEFSEPTTFDVLTENGDQSPGLDPGRPRFYGGAPMTIDSKGRAVMFQAAGGFSEEPLRLLRLLPNGAVDTSFGFGGGIPLKGDVTSPGAIAVDDKDRAWVADSGIQHPYGPRLVRYTAAGKRDWKFGDKGLLEGPIVNDKRGSVDALAIDGKGRVYAAGWVESKTLRTGHGIQIVRFLPGS
jgi:uncharacterized delta-60 repeat protein